MAYRYLTCWLLLSCISAAATAAEARPNLVIALADDLGYGDLACYGHPAIRTPNIDRLAREGMRFTDCYAAGASCSPSRTGLMTGRTPYRVGIHGYIPMFSPMHVGRDEITVAALLRQAGYATCHVGKWHLNGMFNMPEQPQPSDHGLDYWFCTQNNALPNHRNAFNFVRNGEPVGPVEGYSSQVVVDEALRWLTDVRPRSQPFCLFLWFHEPHEPIATDPQFARLYPDADDPRQAAYYGNVTQMDHHFGRLLAALDAQRLRDNTLVLFTSDNGPAVTRHHPYGSAGNLREIKGHVYEGGIRVPGIIRWPGHVPPGATSNEPICGVDLLPTLCELAGAKLPDDRALDGVSITPLFRGERPRRTRPLYWQYNRAPSEPKVAIRQGDYKLLASLSGEPWPRSADITAEMMQSLKTAELERFELYNLRDDIGETKNLAESEPERLRELTAAMRQMYHEVREESPVWPEYTMQGYEGERIIYPLEHPERDAERDGER